MSTERFERTIPYRHTVGTLESIALTEVGKGQDFRLTLTTPDKNAPRVSLYLEGHILDALLEALLDLKDACERR
ncbi:MAG TPA: hypothetical protein PK725_16955, partial [Rhodocyclaceae bacterium]|nr:hypothetical protein [Rhodocyclaceae bacterium]